MSLLTVLDKGASWQWIPPGQDGAPADSRVVVVCRWPSTREHLASGRALAEYDTAQGDQASIDALMRAAAPIVVGVRVGDELRPPDALLDVATPRELREWVIEVFVRAQLTETQRGKSELPSRTDAAACANSVAEAAD